MKTTKATAKMYNASDCSELWRFDCIDYRLLATRIDEDYNKSVDCAVVEDLYYRKRQKRRPIYIYIYILAFSCPKETKNLIETLE